MTCSADINGSAKRLHNTALARASLAQGNPHVEALPRVLFVELTRFCNLACPMCRKPGTIPKSQRMSRELFERIDQELFPTAELVDLRGWGESLILPEFPERARRVRFQGCELRIVTNLSFNRPAVLELLAELEAHISISLDAASPEMVRWIRGGADIGRIVANIKLLTEAYRKRGLEERLCAYVACQQPAIEELPAVLDLLAEAGLTRVLLAPVRVSADSPLRLCGTGGRLQELLCQVQEQATVLGVEVGLAASLFEGHWPREDSTPCSHPWYYCYLTYDGRVGFCDHLMGPDGDPYIMGDLRKSSFHQIWNGPAWQQLRAEHLGLRREEAPLFAECAWCYRNRHIDFEHLLDPDLASARALLTSKTEPL